MADFSARERTVIATFSQLVGLQFQALYFLYRKVQQRENALKQVLGRRGLLTDAEWSEVLREVEAGIAVNVALEQPARASEVADLLDRLAPLLADEDGSILKPVVESLREMFRMRP